MRDVFFGSMSTTQCSKSINSFFYKYVNKKTSLKEFVHKYKQAIEDRQNDKVMADARSSQLDPILRTSSPFEEQLSKVYTHEIFKKV